MCDECGRDCRFNDGVVASTVGMAAVYTSEFMNVSSGYD